MATKQQSRAARLLARRSVKKRREQWGEEEFTRKMREWGKLGGRPRKEQSQGKEKNNG